MAHLAKWRFGNLYCVDIGVVVSDLLLWLLRPVVLFGILAYLTTSATQWYVVMHNLFWLIWLHKNQ
jgi:hypothetical protein